MNYSHCLKLGDSTSAAVNCIHKLQGRQENRETAKPITGTLQTSVPWYPGGKGILAGQYIPPIKQSYPALLNLRDRKVTDKDVQVVYDPVAQTLRFPNNNDGYFVSDQRPFIQGIKGINLTANPGAAGRSAKWMITSDKKVTSVIDKSVLGFAYRKPDTLVAMGTFNASNVGKPTLYGWIANTFTFVPNP